MNQTKSVFQTLEDRNNPKEIETLGPFECSRKNAWLGRGYYFWDSFIENAHWWGDKGYKGKYVICEAKCEFGDDRCFDLVGQTNHMAAFAEAKKLLEESVLLNEDTTVARVIEFLRSQLRTFDFEAIRAYPIESKSAKSNYAETTIFIRGNLAYLDTKPAIQICFMRKDSLNLKHFRIVYPEKYANEKSA